MKTKARILIIDDDAGLGPHRLEVLRRAIAAVGLALGQQFLGHLPVAVRPAILRHGLARPVETEPGQPLDDRVDGLRRGPLAVGILNPQHKRAADARELPDLLRQLFAPGRPTLTSSGNPSPKYSPGEVIKGSGGGRVRYI